MVFKVNHVAESQSCGSRSTTGPSRTILLTLVGKLESSTSLMPLIVGHGTEPVPSSSNQHNLSFQITTSLSAILLLPSCLLQDICQSFSKYVLATCPVVCIPLDITITIHSNWHTNKSPST